MGGRASGNRYEDLCADPGASASDCSRTSASRSPTLLESAATRQALTRQRALARRSRPSPTRSSAGAAGLREFGYG